jgi:corrinoid protein of di/trimethylamine methyltransferase
VERDELFAAMGQSIIDGDAERATSLAEEAVAAGIDPLEAINRGFVPGINVIGEEFSCERVFLPQLVLAGEAMKAAIAVLEPKMKEAGSARQIEGRVVLATVAGDIHDIGKTLVGTMLAAHGFEVFDLGVDVATDAIVEKVREVDADLVGVSALLTTTMLVQKDVVTALDEAGLRPKVKVMVGGAAVTPEWVEQIGADGFGQDAVAAVAMARDLVGAKV